MCRKFINSTPLGCLFVLVCFSSVFAQRGQSNPASLWNKSELHQVPEVKWTGIHDGIKSLIYAGTSYKENGTEVFAYYSNPDLIAGKKNTGKKYPAVVLIHGSGGTAFSQWVGRWARAGYAAIAMDLTGKDPTGKKLPRGGASQSDETMFTDINKGNLKNMWTYQCVANIMLAHSLILSFPEVDKERTAITGISRGGYMTCVAAGVDHRFKAAVPVYGCGFIEESEVLKHGLNRLGDYWKKLWIQTFDPAVYFPGTKMPVMFVNGNKDMFYNVLPYAKSVNLLPVKNRYICIKPDMAHSHQDGWEPPEIEHFFNAILNGKKNPYLK
ncbi:MAG: hypothetical protein EOP48_17285 [Sphingobacteriales bacterium]|nr:MAG: hypothetical protein EOP48_17285 [Sphingobacteriales bacterium]